MSSSTEAGDVEDASDDGVSVVVMTGAVDADKSWSHWIPIPTQFVDGYRGAH